MSSKTTKTINSNFDIVNNQLREDLPNINSGDTIRVDLRIIEGDKSRIQPFEGVVVKTQGSGITYSVVIRKMSNGVFVEKTLPLHSPIVEQVKVIKHGRVRRSRIYYIRNLTGKAARIAEFLPAKQEKGSSKTKKTSKK